MLTPVEIQAKNFKSGIGGYDKKDVDNFFREVTQNYEELYKQNVELMDKISTLNDSISSYKSMERTLQQALILAERTAEDTKGAALKEARHIEREARANAKIIVSDAKKELDEIYASTVKLTQQYEFYKTQFKQLVTSQMELLESDAYNPKIMDKQTLVKKLTNDINLQKETDLDIKINNEIDKNINDDIGFTQSLKNFVQKSVKENNENIKNNEANKKEVDLKKEKNIKKLSVSNKQPKNKREEFDDEGLFEFNDDDL